jgi:hypothetical protein
MYNTGTIKVSLNHTLPISLQYITHKVFKSHVESSQADFLYSSSTTKFPWLSSTGNWLIAEPESESVRVTLRLTVSPSVLVSSPVWGPWPDIYFDWKLLSYLFGAPSLTRGRVCHLSSLNQTNSVAYVAEERTRITESTCHVTTNHHCATSPRAQKTTTVVCWTVFTELLPGNALIKSVTIYIWSCVNFSQFLLTSVGWNSNWMTVLVLKYLYKLKTWRNITFESLHATLEISI